MELLKERIRKDGVIKEGNVLKVDSFLNHRMDIDLINQIGREFAVRFEGEKIDQIMTIEASGIGIAAITAQYFNCPVVFAKKTQSLNLDGNVLTARVESFTKKKTYDIMVESRFVRPGENILIIDDFMAKGYAARGLVEIIQQAGAKVAGIGIVIEKGFQHGGDGLREDGIRVESLAIIEEMDAAAQKIVFRE